MQVPYIDKYTKVKVKVKVKCPVTGPVVAQTVVRGTVLLFHDCGTRRR